jgi:hypothetical protein
MEENKKLHERLTDTEPEKLVLPDQILEMNKP